MILGLLSDTHGCVGRTARALAVLEARGAEALVHCGDVGGPEILDLLAGRPVWFVWGNLDSPDSATRRYVEALGLPVPGAVPLRIELAGRKIAVFHGHEPEFHRLIRALERGRQPAEAPSRPLPDYVFYGHTHRPADTRVGELRLVNPGALQRARPFSVATLDLSSDRLAFWQVDEYADPSAAPVELPFP